MDKGNFCAYCDILFFNEHVWFQHFSLMQKISPGDWTKAQ
jgi:hypothetical protein